MHDISKGDLSAMQIAMRSGSLLSYTPSVLGAAARFFPIFPQNEAQEDAFTIRIRKHCSSDPPIRIHTAALELRSVVPPIFNPSSINHCSW